MIKPYPEEQAKQSGKSAISQIVLFLLLCSKKISCSVKTRYYHRHSRKKTLIIVYFTKIIRGNRTMTICISLELVLWNCMQMTDETSKFSNIFLGKNWGPDSANFQGPCMKEFPVMKDLVQLKKFLYDNDIRDWAMIEEHARRNVAKHSNTVRLLRYNSDNWYDSRINANIKAHW